MAGTPYGRLPSAANINAASQARFRREGVAGLFRFGSIC
jgi:hypothetical protein